MPVPTKRTLKEENIVDIKLFPKDFMNIERTKLS